MEFVTLPTKDGYPTKGHLFKAATPGPTFAVVAPATGIPGRFYSAFASWLSAEHEISTLIVDYRYCGDSFPAGIDTCNADERIASLREGKETSISVSWREDVRAALQFVRETFPGQEICYIANSVGGHLLPLAISPEDKIVRSLFVGVNLPHHAFYEEPEVRQMGVKHFEAAAQELGYFPSRQGGFGDDIPRDAGLDWMRWCHHPRYIASEFSAEYDAFRGRIFSLVFTDDNIICSVPARRAVDRILHLLPLADATRIEIDSQILGWGAVGHAGAFRKARKQDVWPAMLEWISKGEISSTFGSGDRWDSSGFGSHSFLDAPLESKL